MAATYRAPGSKEELPMSRLMLLLVLLVEALLIVVLERGPRAGAAWRGDP